MNVSLTKELETMVNDKVASGNYHSASEVIREGLRLLQEQDQRKAAEIAYLKAEIQVGLDELDRGEYTTYTDETLHLLFEEIKREGRANLKKRQP